MRAALLALLFAAAACGSHTADTQASHTTTAQTPVTHDVSVTNDVPSPSAGPTVWEHTPQSVVCTLASHTTDEATQGDALLPGCKGWPDHDALDYVQGHSWCGPCGFFFDAAATTAERATRADACCYTVRSPPEPFGAQPPPPAPPS